MSSSADTDRCEPNLVPILDMVFQLITFFMLVINFKAVDVDKDLVLPVVGSASPAEQENQGDLLVLNIRGDGNVKIRGAVIASMEGFLRTEAAAVTVLNKLQPGAALPVTVILRVDKNVKFERLMEVVDACKANRFDKFDFVVVRKKEE